MIRLKVGDESFRDVETSELQLQAGDFVVTDPISGVCRWERQLSLEFGQHRRFFVVQVEKKTMTVLWVGASPYPEEKLRAVDEVDGCCVAVTTLGPS